MAWLKRTNFLLVVLTAAFVEGYYLRPVGFYWFVGSVVASIILAVAWMRGHWNG